MNPKLSIIIGMVALSMTSLSLAYGQQPGADIFKPTTFVLGSPQMGAEIPDPTIRVLKYGENRIKRVFLVGEALNIGVENSTGAEIWYIRPRRLEWEPDFSGKSQYALSAW